jgi:hypothetical protein
MDDERRMIAYHEAGHAIADLRLGLGLPHVSIIRDAQKRTLGTTSSYDGWDDERSAHAWLITLYAGFAAESRATPKLADVRRARDDYGRADEILVALYGRRGIKARREEWQGKAAAFVRKKANWRAIERFAAELVEHGEIDGQCADVLLDVADGATTEQQYRAYRARQRWSTAKPPAPSKSFATPAVASTAARRARRNSRT